MRQLFSSFNEEQKNTAYEKLCINIKNNELDQLQNNYSYKIDLSYKLPSSHVSPISIEHYYDAPLGLALLNDHADHKKTLQILFEISEFNDLSIHGPVYIFLAAKKGDDLSILLAQNLFDLVLKKEIILDLNFMINQQVIDEEVYGKRDFFEIAIEKGNEDFIAWILQPKFVRAKIFEPQIKHLQYAIKFFNKNILDNLISNLQASAKDLKECLETEFPCITKNVTYLDYVKQFNPEFYHKLSNYILTKSINGSELNVFGWLLSNGIQFSTEHSLAVKSILPKLQQIYSANDLLEIGIDFNNLQLLKELLIMGNISVETMVKHIKNKHLKIAIDLYDVISPDLYNIILHSKDLEFLIDCVCLYENGLHYKFWKMLGSVSEQRFAEIINYFIKNGMKCFVLNGFLDFVMQHNLQMVIKFIKSCPQHQEFLLNGNEQVTALSIACENSDIPIIKFLLLHVNAYQINKTLSKLNDYANINALWLSCALQEQESIMLLLNHPQIDLEPIKGWHKNFLAGSSVSYKEFDLDFKFPLNEYYSVLTPWYDMTNVLAVNDRCTASNDIIKDFNNNHQEISLII